MSPLESFLETYGYVAVVFGTFFEGETILALAGLAAHRGYLSLPAVVAAGFAGSFVGDQLYFHLGRRRGEAFLAKRPAWGARVARAQRFLERHHVAFILGFRFFYGLRMVSPFAIGMSDVSLRRYLLLNAPGGLVWPVAVALLGYSVGEGAEALLGRVKEIEAWLFLGLAAVGSIVWLVYFAQRRRRRDERSPGDPGSGDGLP
jgi:membrane protein DedA with SNARE-associated domain